MSNPELSLIVPVLDEEGALEELNSSIANSLAGYNYEVLYINDGSTDNSEQILDRLSETDPHVKVIHFVRNYGQTAALTAGIRNSKGNILITLDADLQNDPADIPLMLKELEHCDVVCGWRKDRKDAFLTRTLPSRIANALISKLSNVPLHDYGCTLRVYKRAYIEDIPLYGEMHRFIPIYVTWAGARIVEIPVKHHPRKTGISKYGLWRIPKVLLDLTTLKFLRDFFVTPIYFFGWVGIFLVLMGITILIGSGLLWYSGQEKEIMAALLVLGPVLMTVGLVEVTLGIIAEILIRMHYELQNKNPYRIASIKSHSDTSASPSSSAE